VSWWSLFAVLVLKTDPNSYFFICYLFGCVGVCCWLVGAELQFTLPCSQFVCVVSYIARKKTIQTKMVKNKKQKKDRMKKMRFIYLLGGERRGPPSLRTSGRRRRRGGQFARTTHANAWVRVEVGVTQTRGRLNTRLRTRNCASGHMSPIIVGCVER